MHPIVRSRPLSEPVFAAARAAGYTELQARIIAGRLDPARAEDVEGFIRPTLQALDAPSLLPDILPGVSAIADAICAQSKIAISHDFDCDGSSGSAVLSAALVDYFGFPQEQLTRWVGHRQRDGYGVTDTLTDAILEAIPAGSLLLTTDIGTSDHDRLERLLSNGIRSVVTDHHAVGNRGVPSMALACINPARPDSTFPDPYIAGGYVAFLTACAVRAELISRGYLPKTAPRLTALLDYAALATQADATSLARSRNNRAVILAGLLLMNGPTPRPCWQSVRDARSMSDPFTDRDLGWVLGPIANGMCRLGSAATTVEWLLSKDQEHAAKLCATMIQTNDERKRIERGMTDYALPVAVEQAEQGRASVVVLIPDGMTSVHGITASRLVSATGRPAACVSPKADAPEILSSSLRSIPGVHVQRALMRIMELDPDCLHRAGGHAGAAGAQLHIDQFDRFVELFEQAVLEQVDPSQLAPTVFTDGILETELTTGIVAEIQAAGPYGREYPEPVFTLEATIVSLKVMKEVHLALGLRDPRGRVYRAVWFSAMRQGDCPPVDPGDRVRIAYQPSLNTYRGTTELQLLVEAVERI